MALTACKECGNQVSTLAASCPKCGAPVADRAPAAMVCRHCNIQLVAHEKTSMVSTAGILGAVGFLIGLVALFASPIVGLVIIIASIATGFMRSKTLVMTCPRCGAVA